MLAAWIVAACAAPPPDHDPEAALSEPSHLTSLDKRVPKDTFEKDLDWMVAHPVGVVDALIIDLSEASTAERAAIALGRLQSPSAVPALTRALTAPATTLAGWQAALALAAIPGPEAERALTDATLGADVKVAANAVDALAQRRPAPCEAIRAAIERPEAVVRFHALKSGARVGCFDAASLLRLEGDPDAEIASLAASLRTPSPEP